MENDRAGSQLTLTKENFQFLLEFLNKYPVGSKLRLELTYLGMGVSNSIAYDYTVQSSSNDSEIIIRPEE